MNNSPTNTATSAFSRPPEGVNGRHPGFVGAEAMLFHARAGSTVVAASPHHRIGMHLGAPVNAFCSCDGQSHRRVQSDGDMDIVPAGLDGTWEDDADCTILRISVDPILVSRTAEDLGLDPGHIRIAPHFQLRDEGLKHIALALHAQSASDSGADRLYAESLTTALATRLIDRAGQKFLPSASQQLSIRQKRRLSDHIEANLDRDLSLLELSQVAAVSVSHLKVLFRRTFGMPVHQYVIRRRVERARSLLLLGDAPISQIALETGFAHQSHMAHCMKKLVGATPQSIRVQAR
jgi:AraC family transcriptional regulator